MLFTHDTEQGLRSAAELINTGRNDRELLPDVAALPPLLDRYGWTGRRDGDDAELEAVKALRARLGDIWARINDEEYVVRQVNALLADTHASPWRPGMSRNPTGTCTWPPAMRHWLTAWVPRPPWYLPIWCVPGNSGG
ncbi:conserved protein containing a Zn-ribbon-like motif, possibly RNA-binding [Mycobacteroides abscessus subsp. abscessus]|nr:conserved protein containing a Zn-ribbon-like motif, possibly RNA-binding [Mycobacteroides abscessus subsp. abscessus]